MSRSTGLIWCAGLLGLLNAAPSYYWAFGGDVLLQTIGAWLIELRAETPILTGVALLGIGLGKTLAVVIPLVAAQQLRSLPVSSHPMTSQRLEVRGRGAHPVLWWNLSRLIAAGLIVYAAVGLLINAGQLLWPGLELQDPTARLGQALLWYPLLLAWGLVLAVGLRRLRATVGV